MKSFLIEIMLPVIAIFAAVIIPILIVGNVLANDACDTYAKLSGLEQSYSFTTECLLKQDGRWVSAKALFDHKQEITLHKEK